MEMTFVPLALLGAAILLLVIFFYYVPFLLWISAKVSGVNISLIQLFLMRIRNVPPYVITAHDRSPQSRSENADP